MEQGRNETCNCGSGLKYKKCCINKNQQPAEDSKVNFSMDSLLSVVRIGLENLDAFEGSNNKVNVKTISVVNIDTILCEFYSYADNSIDIKVETSVIISFMSAFFKDELESYGFRYYAAKAYDNNDQELLYAISSKETAQLIGQGNSIDWLKSTLFQENTSDYRLGQAKKIISEIENSLRHVITEVLNGKYGNDWWSKSMDNKLGKGVKQTYSEQFGEEISDGDILIKYTYTIQLKKIISTHWSSFNHLFDNKIEFENAMDKLNLIRREEAHNRNITEEQLSELKNLYYLILSKVSESYPEFIPTYLIDNWRLKIKVIMSDSYKPLFSGNELIDEENPILKFNNSIQTTKHMIEYIEDKVGKLKSIVVPVQKKSLHDELLDIFSQYLILQEKKLEKALAGEHEELLSTLKLIEQHEKQFNNFAEKFLLSEA